MINLYFTDCQWGTEPIDNGIQINLLEPDAKIMAQIPFSGEALTELARVIMREVDPATLKEIMIEQEIHGK